MPRKQSCLKSQDEPCNTLVHCCRGLLESSPTWGSCGEYKDRKRIFRCKYCYAHGLRSGFCEQKYIRLNSATIHNRRMND